MSTDHPLPCPQCGHLMDVQHPYTEGLRSYQHLICDNAECSVSSVRIEWRTS